MTPDEPTPEPIEVHVSDKLTFHEALGLHKTGADSEGQAVSERDWSASAESTYGTIVHATSTGRPSEGEDDTEACAARFVRFCRSKGEVWWDDPIPVDPRDRPWVDYEAADRRDPKGQRLQMQVQRAMVGEGRYKEWAREEHTGLPPGTTTEQAAALLIEAIENKRPAASREVILLLDAARLPWLALGEVVAEVRRQYVALATKVDFQAIYVVPWVESAIRRLDQPE